MNVDNGVSYGSSNGAAGYGDDPAAFVLPELNDASADAAGFFFGDQLMGHGMPDQQPQQQHQQMMMHQQPQPQQQPPQQQQQHQPQQQQQQQPMGYPMSPSPNSMMRLNCDGHIKIKVLMLLLKSARVSGISSPALARALSTLSADRNRRPRSEKKPIPDEQKDDKYFERRRRNNEAAKKSRDARKAREDELAIRASYLEKDNSILKVQVHSMREEAMKMRELWVAKCQGLAISRQQMQQQQQQQQQQPQQPQHPQQMVQGPPPQQQNQMQMNNGQPPNGRPGLMLNQVIGHL
ncbi:D site-binding protein [Elysia marginata]|uniref:D site-binding protein n=1 Tax=Elysia marginata TaxID=1093978 RepID=A0AAV4EYX3_9GAST|nr:D site-binding protein [Elysia marginata]